MITELRFPSHKAPLPALLQLLAPSNERFFIEVNFGGAFKPRRKDRLASIANPQKEHLGLLEDADCALDLDHSSQSRACHIRRREAGLG